MYKGNGKRKGGGLMFTPFRTVVSGRGRKGNVKREMGCD